MNCSSAIEPLGKSEGAKEAASRSIKQLFKLFKFEKLGRQRDEMLFGTLRRHSHGKYGNAAALLEEKGYMGRGGERAAAGGKKAES